MCTLNESEYNIFFIASTNELPGMQDVEDETPTYTDNNTFLFYLVWIQTF